MGRIVVAWLGGGGVCLLVCTIPILVTRGGAYPLLRCGACRVMARPGGEFESRPRESKVDTTGEGAWCAVVAVVGFW